MHIVRPGPLRAGGVELVFAARRERSLLHIADDADNRGPWPVSAAHVGTEAHTLANGILAREDAIRVGFIEEHRFGYAGNIVFIKQAASTKWNVHRFQVSRRDRVAKRGIGAGASFELNAIHILIATERQLAGETGGYDARHLTHSIQSLLKKLQAHCIAVVAMARFLNLHCEQVSGFEARIDCGQMLHAAQQQSCADEQHDRERYLRDD